MRRRRLPFQTHALRLWLGAVVCLCLLINQWAIAAYACPSGQAKLPCHAHVDKQHPALCHQHCDPTSLSDVDGKTPTVPPTLMPALAPADIYVAWTEPQRGYDLDAALAASPPPILRFCRLLI